MSDARRFGESTWKTVFDFILSTVGEPHRVYGRVYRDETVAIYDRTLGGGGLTVERVENGNPVIVFHERSNTFLRYHGEFATIEGHVRNLAVAVLQRGSA